MNVFFCMRAYYWYVWLRCTALRSKLDTRMQHSHVVLIVGEERNTYRFFYITNCVCHACCAQSLWLRRAHAYLYEGRDCPLSTHDCGKSHAAVACCPTFKATHPPARPPPARVTCALGCGASSARDGQAGGFTALVETCQHMPGEELIGAIIARARCP